MDDMKSYLQSAYAHRIAVMLANRDPLLSHLLRVNAIAAIKRQPFFR